MVRHLDQFLHEAAVHHIGGTGDVVGVVGGKEDGQPGGVARN
jgi:hypothetical protein